MGKAQLEQLEKYGSYVSVPKGISMKPLIHQGKDMFEIVRLEKPPQRYDVVMYVYGQRKQGIIHRVYRVRDKQCIIFGDNCWRKEIVPMEHIAGKAVRVFRNGKWYDMQTSRGYRLYAWFWTNTLLIRRPILWARDQGKRVVGKVKRIRKTN